MAEPSLRRFRPTSADPWNRIKAAHLLNRAGFGGTPEQVTRVASMRMEAAVDELLNYERTPDGPFPEVDFSGLWDAYAALLRARRERADERTLRDLVNQINRLNRQKFQELRANWIARMNQSSRPLLEKMVLFWHGLLVSGFPDTQVSEHMAIQLDLFRRMATGSFKELILAVSRDPAMLSYLDNNNNRKGRPNENYARELMELFTMGVGNYAEADVKEAARAFTGWTFVGNEFVFRRNQHDDGLKTFLGRTGAWDGTDVIDIIFEQPATARFLPRRLWESFAYLGPEDSLLEDLAGLFRRSNWEIRPVLRAIFQSEAFYSENALRAQIKTPAQLVIGAVRLTGAAIPELGLARAMDLMGQALLYPPNVGGWPRGQRWVNTATMLVRYNFSNLLISGAMPGVGRQRPTAARVNHLIDAGKVRTAGDVVDQLVDRFLQYPLDGRRRWALLRVFETNREGAPVALEGARGQEQLRSAVHLIMSMPEFQLH
jgi:hypothetical protein